MFLSTDKPHPQAARKKCTVIRKIYLPHLEGDSNKEFREKWYSTGSDHKVIGELAEKHVKELRWVIEVASLDDLTKLVAESGEIVVGVVGDNKDIPFRIEIYDEYRE